MKPSRHFLRGEFIGLPARVESRGLDSPKSGVVVDETRNTLILKSRRSEVTVPKRGSTIQFVLRDGRVVEVPGELIVGRPEDRIKKRFGKVVD